MPDFYGLPQLTNLGLAVLALGAVLFMALAYIVGKDLWQRYKGP